MRRTSFVATVLVLGAVLGATGVAGNAIGAGGEEAAAAASGSTDAASVSTTAGTDADADKKDERPFGVTLGVSHSFGTGNFVRHAQLRKRSDYIGQGWRVTPYYKFDAWGHQAKASASASFDVELTTPDANPPRRFKPQDVVVSLGDAEAYVDGLTGVKLGLGARFYLPASFESLRVKKQWGAGAVSASASRTFGSVTLDYSLTPTKYFQSSKVPDRYRDVARAGEGAGKRGAGLDPIQLSMGFANADFSISNALSLAVDLTDALSVSYAVSILNIFRYDLVADDNDEFSAPSSALGVSDTGRGRVDMLSPSLEVSYALNDVVGQWLDLPFELAATAGISAMHPAQTADNKGILWPFFYPVFAQNRAAMNYGSIYFDLVGTY